MAERPARGRVNRSGGKGRRLGAALLVLVTVGAVLGGMAWASVKAYDYTVSLPVFSVKELKVTGLKYVRTGDFISYMGDPRGKSVFKVDVDELQKKVAAHPWIGYVSVRRELPCAVRVEVSERVPVAIADTGSGRFLIDKDGLALAMVSGPSWDFLPAIACPSVRGLKLVDPKTAGDLKKAIELISLVRQDPTETLTGACFSLDSDGHPSLTLEGSVVRVGPDGYSDKLRRLIEVLQDIRRREARPSLIDLRFPGKVVVKGGPIVP